MKTIAILVAMKMEAEQMIRRIEDAKPEKAAGKRFLRGRVGDAEVVLHICGWGMSNAAKGARALIEYARPDALVSYGVSGGMTADIGLGDTVVAVSTYPASGKYSRTGEAIPTDEKLADFAAGLLPDARKAPVSTSLGLIVNKKRKARIQQASGTACMDMETYTAAMTARELGVPLLVIRSMSDTLEPTSLLSFSKNGAMAAEKAAAETEMVIKGLASL